MGAKIHGAGEGILTVDGVDELRTVRHAVIPDRIETGTFMAAAAVTGGDVTLLGADARHLDAVMLKFRESGVEFHDTDRGLRVTSSGRLSASDLKTMPYPGFPTDMQAQFMAMMSVAKGTSIIQERIFENRFMHVAELRRMGADISEEAGVATVRGGKALRGAEVMATDLRASASLVVAALAAHGTSTIYRLYHLDRGYDRIEEKLRRLGASVKRVKGRA
jgi:UDP-N-acetylglucosamine 1-carboxyvinyltransferase